MFAAIIEPIANKFMRVQELIEVKWSNQFLIWFEFIEITITWFECFSWIGFRFVC
jgi:hypothetical protein